MRTSMLGSLVVIALVLGPVGSSRADELDLTGHWQVNMDCDFYATATSFVKLDTDVTTGDLTALTPDKCGTIEFPTSIEEMIACSVINGLNVGRVSGTLFDLPTTGQYRNEAVFDPFFYPFIGCTVERFLIDLRYDGRVRTDELGNAVSIDGTVTTGYIEFREPGDVLCFSFPDAPDCTFDMRRNDIAVGSQVSVEPRVGTTLTFDTVSAPGTVSVMPLTEADASVPANFQVYAPGAPVPIYYDVDTNATVSGPITTCFDYQDFDDDGIIDGSNPWVFESNIQVLHEEGGEFVDRTSFVDTEANFVCAETTSFSQVTVVTPADPVIPWQDRSVAKAKLVVKRSRTGTEKVVFVTKDPDFMFPEAQTINDPRRFVGRGVTLELFAHGEGTVATFGGYHRFRLNSSSDKYGSYAESGAFKMAKIVRGRVLKVKLKATGLALTAPQGSMAARVTTGLLRHCASFTGSGVSKDLPGRFVGKIKEAALLPDCTDASLGIPGSPSGAFLD